MKTKSKEISLTELIEKGKFRFVNSNITPDNFPVEPIRSEEYKVFHFDRYISSEEALKEIEGAGYLPANIYELLSWTEWNGKDWVIALGSSCVLDGRRHVPGLRGFGSGRGLGLDWWRGGWGGGYRFLAVRNSTVSLGSKTEELKHLDPQTLCPNCGKEVKIVLEKV
jgi:hypothetical protein